jgi:hypothetical protein
MGNEPAGNGRAVKRAHLACGVSLAQINQMQLAASGSGECPPANNSRGARTGSTGTHVNNTEKGTAVSAAESSCPTRCWTGTG